MFPFGIFPSGSVPVTLLADTVTIDASCTALAAILDAITVAGKEPALIWDELIFPVMLAAFPEMFPLTLLPATATMEASCTELTAMLDAMTVAGNEPAEIFPGVSDVKFAPLITGNVPVKFAAGKAVSDAPEPENVPAYKVPATVPLDT